MNREAAYIRWELARRSFREYLGYHHFVGRETGGILRFGAPSSPCFACKPGRCTGVGLWPGQEQLVEAVEVHDWVFGLKSGKLGFSELACAFDAWVLLFGHPRARVHLFSKDDQASKSLLKYVKFALGKLPPEWGVQFKSGIAGANTAKSLMVHGAMMDPEDLRECWSYPATGNVAIDQSCLHSHVDELSHMADAEALWNSVSTTIAPGGSCHIVTRGHGNGVYSYQLWQAAKAAPAGQVGRYPYPFPMFANYLARPDRTPEMRQAVAESGAMTQLGLSYYLPESEDDALRGDESSPYIPLEVWDTLFDKDVPPLVPGDRTPLVVGLDAAVTGDCFAAVAASRHPLRHDDAAIRAVRVWRPEDSGGRIDFEAVERWIRLICEGGCSAGHPRSMPVECEACKRSDWSMPSFNVTQICFDPFQLEDLSQRLNRAGIAWMSAYDQGAERLIGDALLYKLAMTGQLTHNGDPTLREHVGNCKAKLQPDADSRMRIVKRSPEQKVDAAVAAAMAVKRLLALNL